MKQQNNAFACKRRDMLRNLLQAAARKGVLPWGMLTRLSDFDKDSNGSNEQSFVDLDEDLEGDYSIDGVALPHC